MAYKKLGYIEKCSNSTLPQAREPNECRQKQIQPLSCASLHPPHTADLCNTFLGGQYRYRKGCQSTASRLQPFFTGADKRDCLQHLFVLGIEPDNGNERECGLWNHANGDLFSVLAVFFLKESFTQSHLAGMVLIFLGIYASTFYKKSR